MSSDSVILISPPYITVSPSEWLIRPPIPIESDLVYHLRTSFESYDKVPFFEPKWTLLKSEENIQLATFFIHKNDKNSDESKWEVKEEKMMPLVLDMDSIDDCYENASRVSDTVNFIFLWNDNPHSCKNMDIILKKIDEYKKNGNVRIISIIPDGWPRNIELIEVMEEHTKLCDKTVVLYEGTIPFLRTIDRHDIADKMIYIPCLPMVLNEKRIYNKHTDFCYIGCVIGQYEHRAIATIRVMESFPEKTFFTYTDGKTNNPNNILSRTKDFIDKMGESKYSIMTSTMPGIYLNSKFFDEAKQKLENDLEEIDIEILNAKKTNSAIYRNRSDFQWPSVLPGRMAESVINMTIPIYVKLSLRDTVPKIFDGYDAWIYINISDSDEEVRKKIESVSTEKIKQNMMRLYNDFISPESVIPKLLERS